MLNKLQTKHGNKWTTITRLLSESTGIERSWSQVEGRFRQLKVESADDHVQKRKVIFTQTEDAQLVAFKNEWLEEHENTYGMWNAMAATMTGKTRKDLQNRWDRKLSKSKTLSVVTSSAVTSSTMTLSAAIPALVPAMPSLSLAMPALPPVIGLDDWSFSPYAMPMLDYDENVINVETVAKENEMEFEFVAI